MDPDQQLRNLRDFLLVYNRMTEICFRRCTSNFNYRNLTMDESCVDSCAGKLIRTNHRLMGTYVQLMPRMVQRRMEEMESKAAENAKAAEAAAIATSEAAPAIQTPINSSPPTQITPSVTKVAPEVHDSALKQAGLGIPAKGISLSPAAPLTPRTENVSELKETGPLNTAGFPQPAVSGIQNDQTP
ncbi:mitochondrial import inner membrane translocase subunit Tim10 B isoform X2 [Girardinichthys multiradiatus]|uniref:mitochondrial import inner membrane translocase subunit Tim10 B isoform X2 n=1 Tax=Girardinichthys multiradiatus TaxID=208333 RepID=UPI001FAB9BCE|nr:mitochondrial import inner membrane translocase subunit Tim10 B isoform X2 [Girardinichthys multiradiatus]